jgi:galactokinase
MPPDWTFVIGFSGIQADKADSVKDRYNRASNRARALLQIWNAHAPAPAPSLADALMSAPDAIDRLRSWIAPTADGAFTAADLTARLDHFAHETARGPLAFVAFRDADRDALGRLSAESQREAGELLGNQIPETILMAQLARDLGAFGASSFGAGFGGSVWAAVPMDEAEAFGKAWSQAYEAAVPSAGTIPWFIARPGPPATEV